MRRQHLALAICAFITCLALALAAVGPSCAPPTSDLVGATREQVLERLGPPRATATVKNCEIMGLTEAERLERLEAQESLLLLYRDVVIILNYRGRVIEVRPPDAFERKMAGR